MSKKIVVTGGSGAAASYVIKELLEHSYEVKNLGITAPPET
jgi:nucleoside-diphosphate-sugar epimerase